ncbi:MAG: zinc-dependent peptidase [Gemmataceae bacterium]
MNLCFHEFAHQLDMTNGEFDGVPCLPKPLRQPWADIMGREFKKLGKSPRRKADGDRSLRRRGAGRTSRW